MSWIFYDLYHEFNKIIDEVRTPSLYPSQQKPVKEKNNLNRMKRMLLGFEIGGILVRGEMVITIVHGPSLPRELVVAFLLS